MKAFEHGTRQCYQAGCRLEQCKEAEAAYKRDWRRQQREKVGEFAVAPVTALSLVTGDGTVTPTSSDAYMGRVESAVQAEIEGLGSSRPGLVAAALELARVMDNPKAVSTKPAAAARLEGILETLRKNSDGRKSKLATVRSMTKPQVKTG